MVFDCMIVMLCCAVGCGAVSYLMNILKVDNTARVLIGNGRCGGHPQNEVRKIQVPRLKVAKNTSPCHIWVLHRC